MVQLDILYLADNQIGDKGMNSFSTALVSGALPQLETLVVSDNPASAEAQHAAKETIKNRE